MCLEADWGKGQYAVEGPLAMLRRSSRKRARMEEMVKRRTPTLAFVICREDATSNSSKAHVGRNGLHIFYGTGKMKERGGAGPQIHHTSSCLLGNVVPPCWEGAAHLFPCFPLAGASPHALTLTFSSSPLAISKGKDVYLSTWVRVHQPASHGRCARMSFLPAL